MIHKTTLKWLKDKNACIECVDWFEKQKERDSIKVLKKLIKEDRLDWTNWTICRIFDYKQRIQYAVFAAKQVLSIFEKKYPDDKRPRNAIKTAIKCIDHPSNDNKKAAAACVAAADPAPAAAYAGAAYAAAYAAAAAAANADYAPPAPAADAYDAAAYAVKKKIKLKILNYGISLLKEEG